MRRHGIHEWRTLCTPWRTIFIGGTLKSARTFASEKCKVIMMIIVNVPLGYMRAIAL